MVRWDTWTPTDPATLAEVREREEEEDQKKSKEFEETNPDFCKQMVDDMKSRSEARRVRRKIVNAALQLGTCDLVDKWIRLVSHCLPHLAS